MRRRRRRSRGSRQKGVTEGGPHLPTHSLTNQLLRSRTLSTCLQNYRLTALDANATHEQQTHLSLREKLSAWDGTCLAMLTVFPLQKEKKPLE